MYCVTSSCSYLYSIGRSITSVLLTQQIQDGLGNTFFAMGLNSTTGSKYYIIYGISSWKPVKLPLLLESTKKTTLLSPFISLLNFFSQRFISFSSFFHLGFHDFFFLIRCYRTRIRFHLISFSLFQCNIISHLRR